MWPTCALHYKFAKYKRTLRFMRYSFRRCYILVPYIFIECFIYLSQRVCLNMYIVCDQPEQSSRTFLHFISIYVMYILIACIYILDKNWFWTCTVRFVGFFCSRARDWNSLGDSRSILHTHSPYPRSRFFSLSICCTSTAVLNIWSSIFHHTRFSKYIW